MDKPITAALIVFFLLTANARAVVDAVFVLKAKEMIQTSSANPIEDPNFDPYVFEAIIEESSSGDPINAAVIQSPGGTVSSTNLIYDPLDTEWVAKDSAATETALNTKLNNGTYRFDVTFDSAGLISSELDLTGDFFSTDPKISSLSNAIWNNDQLEVDPNMLATIGFTVDAGFSNGTDFMGIRIEDGFGGELGDISGFTALSSVTIGPGGDFSLMAGSYKLEFEVANLSDRTPTNDLLNPSIQAAAGYTTLVNVDLVVIPEPEFYGLGLGFISLMAIWVLRSRKNRSVPLE